MIGVDEAMSSQDTFISVADGSPSTYTEIAHIKTIPGPNQTQEDIDVTHLRSTGGYREFVPSFKDAGELQCTSNFLPGNTTHQLVRDLYASRERRAWQITYPDGSLDNFMAYVKAIGSQAGVGNALEQTFTIKITGEVVLTPVVTSP